ncbi:MAG: hypothetical protein EPO08_08160 [Rhodospirillaceae bacterium]|nr:MAG: hypothetical protein EPO08_08160 [Rhodospirillaceae bacterium]
MEVLQSHRVSIDRRASQHVRAALRRNIFSEKSCGTRMRAIVDGVATRRVCGSGKIWKTRIVIE